MVADRDGMVSLTPQQRVIAKRVDDEGLSYVLARTVPIYMRARDGLIKAHGTGVLLKIADAGFLLSAAHVLDPEKRAVDGDNVGPHAGPALYVGTAPVGVILSLEGLDCQVSHDRRDIDFAFMRLPADVDRALGEHKQFLRLDQVDVNRSHELSAYAVVGFPVAYCKIDHDAGLIDSPPISHMTILQEGLVNFTDGISIAVAFPPSVVAIGDTGEHVRPPELNGISGCGIWRMVGEDAWRRGRWDPSMIRLAGIEHTVIPRKAIKGVLIHRVIGAIRRLHPDLAPAIDLHRQDHAAR